MKVVRTIGWLLLAFTVYIVLGYLIQTIGSL